MHELTRSDTRTELAPRTRTEMMEVKATPQGARSIAPQLVSEGTSLDQQSVGELVNRLAQESRDLASVELRRLRVEMRQHTRRAARAAAAGYVAVDFIALATLALAIGLFLVLADWWNSYAAAAFATSGVLALVAVVAALAARGILRRISQLGAPGPVGGEEQR